MMNIQKTLPLVLAGLLLATPAVAQDSSLRTDFMAALAAAEAGVAAPRADSETLRGYRLYPYLRAARLIRSVQNTKASDAEVEHFLGEYPDLPVSRELRRAWLNNLAARGAWAELLRRYQTDSDDQGLVCHRYQALIETGATEGLRDELAQFWASAPQMPQACVAPFRWLQDQGALTPERVELRTRQALTDGNLELADWLTRQVPAARRAPLLQWARLLRDPARELKTIAASPAASFEWPALLEGFSRLARRDSALSLQILQQFDRSRLDAAQHAELQRWVALGLSWDRKPEAIAAFKALPESALDARVYEWRVRSALWNNELELAAQWLHQLHADLAADARWIYWRARTLEALGRSKQSAPIYQTLAQENGYYSLLAAWRLGQPYRAQSRPLSSDPALQAQLLQRPALLRARELNAIERPQWANAEWRAATADLDLAGRQQAAQLASAWGWHVQAVAMLAQSGGLDHLEVIYPDAYSAEIRAAAQGVGLQPAWIYGVMRQESLFHPQAVSSANAYGLLQLLLPTAQAVARRWQLPRPTREALFRPEVNLPLGAAYLREMTDRFNGQFLLTLAAYNAGPNAVARWLPSAPMPADFWIENMPYNETRGYVQRVLWHMAVRATLDGEPLDLPPLLKAVHVAQ